MKRIFYFIMALCLVMPAFADRAHTLKIYNWADYLDMDNVLDKFPEWYKE